MTEVVLSTGLSNDKRETGMSGRPPCSRWSRGCLPCVLQGRENLQPVEPILEKMDGSDDSFEAALQELCTYMCGPDGKTGVDAVTLNTLSDGQRHPEGTYELTLDGKLLLDADGKPRKIPR